MRKLRLKDLVGYMPYNAKLMLQDGSIVRLDSINQTYKKTIWIGYKKRETWKDFNYSYLSKLTCIGRGFKLSEVKIILHPMSDLIKPIRVEGYNDGKEFVPLVELAKNSDIVVSEYTLKILSTPPNCIEIGDGYVLQYLGDSFMCLNSGDNEYSPINNFALFDLLNQWHFDYRGLIKDGLAVDINTIKL